MVEGRNKFHREYLSIYHRCNFLLVSTEEYEWTGKHWMHMILLEIPFMKIKLFTRFKSIFPTQRSLQLPEWVYAFIIMARSRCMTNKMESSTILLKLGAQADGRRSNETTISPIIVAFDRLIHRFLGPTVLVDPTLTYASLVVSKWVGSKQPEGSPRACTSCRSLPQSERVKWANWSFCVASGDRWEDRWFDVKSAWT